MNSLVSVPPKNLRETETLMPRVSNAQDSTPAEDTAHGSDAAARTGNTNRRTRFSFQSVARTALRRAERQGFRSAIIGRACAILAIGSAYFAILQFPSNL